MRVDVDPGAVAFVASFLRGGTSSHVWDSYQTSLPPDHAVTWGEFKKTLRDNLDDEDAFIDKTWSNFFTYQQWPGESVRAFSVTLQPIYAVLREYDPIAAPRESMMICRMRRVLCPEIRAALFNTGERVKNFTIFMNRAMSAEASAAMRAAGGARQSWVPSMREALIKHAKKNIRDRQRKSKNASGEEDIRTSHRREQVLADWEESGLPFHKEQVMRSISK